MSSAKFLDYEIALLLAKYGRGAVERALAHRVNMTVEELESTLQALPERNNARRARKKFSLSEVVEQFAKEYPQKAIALRDLAGRFENRRFLSELREVKRFFEQHGRQPATFKSRVDAGPTLLALLAQLDLIELEALLHEERDNSYSSLGLISDQILGKGK